jgi:hypothetical protein
VASPPMLSMRPLPGTPEAPQEQRLGTPRGILEPAEEITPEWAAAGADVLFHAVLETAEIVE